VAAWQQLISTLLQATSYRRSKRLPPKAVAQFELSWKLHWAVFQRLKAATMNCTRAYQELWTAFRPLSCTSPCMPGVPLISMQPSQASGAQSDSELGSTGLSTEHSSAADVHCRLLLATQCELTLEAAAGCCWG